MWTVALFTVCGQSRVTLIPALMFVKPLRTYSPGFINIWRVQIIARIYVLQILFILLTSPNNKISDTTKKKKNWKCTYIMGQ